VRLRLPDALPLHVVGAHSSQRSLHLLFTSCFGDEQQQIRLGCNTVTAAAMLLRAVTEQDAAAISAKAAACCEPQSFKLKLGLLEQQQIATPWQLLAPTTLNSIPRMQLTTW
jgi:hypothetical protein